MGRFKEGDHVRLVRRDYRGDDWGVDTYIDLGDVKGVILRRCAHPDEYIIRFDISGLFGNPPDFFTNFHLHDSMLEFDFVNFEGGVTYRVYKGQRCWQQSFNPALLIQERVALALDRPLDDLDLKIGAKGAMARGVIKSTGEEFALLEMGS